MNKIAVDPGSLDRLHDLALAPPAPWWPPAIGWVVLAALILVLVAAVLGMQYLNWRRNWYRRAGLAELQRIATSGNNTQALAELAELVKRVALLAYPRTSVASQSGSSWLAFLDSSCGGTDFTHGAGRQLEDAYQSGTHIVSPQLIAAVEHWITHHRASSSC